MRLRFSLRTLFVVVTLVGLYFGLWEVTKQSGIADVMAKLEEQERYPNDADISARGPLIIEVGQFMFSGGSNPLDAPLGGREWRREYYFWFFGYVKKLSMGEP